MGRVIARTPAQVIAAEAGMGTASQRYADMKGIASVVANRMAVTNATAQQVVGVNKQFNGYGKPMPPGTTALVGMAQKAIDDVSINGPVHAGTFFATPKTTKNLGIKGLQKVDETTAHQYFTDPQARSIQTSVGTLRADYSQLAAAPAPRNVPSPQFAQRDVGGLLAQGAPMAMGLAPAPVATGAMAAINSALSPAKAANLAGRLGPAPLSPAQEANLASRLGPVSTKQTLNAAQERNLSERLGVPVSTPAITKTALSPAQERNLASRFGDMDPATEANVKGRLDAASPAPSLSIGGLLGVNPAAAGTLTSSPAKTTAPAKAATSTGFAGPVGSPRSMEATIAGPTAGARYAPAPAAVATTALASTPSPSPNFAGTATISPRAAEEQSMASLNTQDAVDAGMFSRPAPVKATPALSPEAALAADVADQRKAQGLPALSAPKVVSTPPATYNAPAAAPVSQPAYATSYAPQAPQSIEGAVGQNRQTTGLGLPSIPDAPGFNPFKSVGGYLGDNKGKLAGGLLGSAFGGPIGGLLGGLLGTAAQKSMTTQPSAALVKAAPALGFDGFSYPGLGSISLGDLGYGVGIGGISIRGDGSTGLGAPGVPGAPTGAAGYSTDSRGSESASSAARATAGMGRGLY